MPNQIQVQPPIRQDRPEEPEDKPPFSEVDLEKGQEHGRKHRQQHQRAILYTDSFFIQVFDGHETVSRSLFGSHFSMFLVRWIIRPLSVPLTICAGAYLGLVLYAQKHGWADDYALAFQAAVVIPLFVQIAGILLYIRPILMHSFSHFETVYLIANAIITTLTCAHLIQFGPLVIPVGLVGVCGSLSGFIVDAWMVSFSSVDRHLRRLCGLVPASRNGGQLADIQEYRQEKPLSYLQMIERVSTVYTYLFQTEKRGGWRQRMARSVRAITVLGYRAVGVVITLCLITLLIYIFVVNQKRSSLDLRQMSALQINISTLTLFKVSCMNCFVYTLRRLFMTLWSPLKVYCLSRRLIKVPLVQSLLDIGNSSRRIDAIHKLREHYTIHRSTSFPQVFENIPSHQIQERQAGYKKSTKANSFEVILWESKQKSMLGQLSHREYNANRVESLQEAGIKENPSPNPVQECIVENEQPDNVKQDKMKANEPEAIAPQPYSHEAKFKYNLVFATPLNESFMVDYDINFLDGLFPKKIAKIIAGKVRIILKYTHIVVVIAPFLTLVNLVHYSRPLMVICTLFNLTAILQRLFLLSLFSRSATWRALQTFETVYGWVNLLVFVIFAGRYYGWENPEVATLFLYLLAVSTALLLIDAYPVSFGHIDKVIRTEFDRLMGCHELRPKDAGLLAAIVDLANMVMAFDNRKSAQAWNNLEELSENGSFSLHHKKREAVESFLHLENQSTFSDRVKLNMKLFNIVSYTTFASTFVTVAWIICFLVLSETHVLRSGQSETFHTWLGYWDLRSIMFTSVFNFLVTICKRWWAHIKDPLRCVCFERRIVKMPYVSAIDDYWERVTPKEPFDAGNSTP